MGFVRLRHLNSCQRNITAITPTPGVTGSVHPVATDNVDRSCESRILASTIGWLLTHHARVAAAVRNFDVRDVLTAAEAPEESWRQDYFAPGREMRCRGDVAVVVHPADRVIITVLWNNGDRWTDEQAASRNGVAS